MKKTRNVRNDISQDELCQNFEDELRIVENAGVSIYLDGQPRPLGEIAQCCMLRERGHFQCEYRCNEEGRIAELHFCRFPEEAGR